MSLLKYTVLASSQLDASASPASIARASSLDVLRCAAILLVIGFHLNFYATWSRFGWVGVDLFFVLSGFLISGRLFSEYLATERISFRRFFWRRAMRIWPPFYVFVAAVGILFFFFQKSPFPWQPFLATSLFTQNYFRTYPLIAGGAFVHLWSLAVEEHFYLLLPLLFLFFLRRRCAAPFNAIPLLFVIISTSCLLARFLTVRVGTLAWASHLRMDSLFAGVTLRYFFHFKPDVFQKLASSKNLAIAAVLLIPATLLDSHSWFMQTIGLTGLWCSFTLLLAWSMRREQLLAGNRILKCAAAIGFYSYSIYLWHLFFIIEFDSLGRTALAFWAALSSAIGFGILMSKIVEWPVRVLRDRWFPTPF
jgi:peptidoglycan/LPS O-acetylase OafA/YrhL